MGWGPLTSIIVVHRMRFDEDSTIPEYFALPRITASELGLETVGGVPVSGDTVVYPLVASLPMGWTWSLHFAQTTNSRRMRSLEELAGCTELTDRGTAALLPAAPGAFYTYVDNLGVLMSKGTATRRATRRILLWSP